MMMVTFSKLKTKQYYSDEERKKEKGKKKVFWGGRATYYQQQAIKQVFIVHSQGSPFTFSLSCVLFLSQSQAPPPVTCISEQCLLYFFRAHPSTFLLHFLHTPTKFHQKLI